jgi:hypothetical protein
MMINIIIEFIQKQLFLIYLSLCQISSRNFLSEVLEHPFNPDKYNEYRRQSTSTQVPIQDIENKIGSYCINYIRENSAYNEQVFLQS